MNHLWSLRKRIPKDVGVLNAFISGIFIYCFRQKVDLQWYIYFSDSLHATDWKSSLLGAAEGENWNQGNFFTFSGI